ncbi:MAG: ORF6N domain-containing protein [Cyclobacteriaceae bacterium]|nr:ORF6N domain-containing protein [Cyclobacteriaceae bacterium]
MTKEEMEGWKSQIVISNQEKMGLRKPPLVFTEQGVTMLSCVLNSERAIHVNIRLSTDFYPDATNAFDPQRLTSGENGWF